MKNFFLISTGGSGGHVIPAMILHDHLSEKADLIVSTDKRGKKYIDKKIQSIEIVNTPKLNSFLLFPINFVIVLLLIIKLFLQIFEIYIVLLPNKIIPHFE